MLAKEQLHIRARAIQMMDALGTAGAGPVPGDDLHSFAYFANILSPVWGLDPVQGSVLKDPRGPFFPALDAEIHILVAAGVFQVLQLGVGEGKAKNRIIASFVLNRPIADEFIEQLLETSDERNLSRYLLELAFAFVEIQPSLRDDAALVDAAWSDPSIADGRVVDFGEWVEATRDNAAINVIRKIDELAPHQEKLTASEQVVLYMRLMKKRANG